MISLLEAVLPTEKYIQHNKILIDNILNSDNDKKLYAGQLNEFALLRGFCGLSNAVIDQNHLYCNLVNPFPFPDSSIDFFQSEDVFEHIPYSMMISVLNEIYRILKPGAQFRFSLPDYNSSFLKERTEKNTEGTFVFDPGGGGTKENPGHVWFPTNDSVSRILNLSKFKDKFELIQGYVSEHKVLNQPIDHSYAYVSRCIDNDQRCKTINESISLVYDGFK